MGRIAQGALRRALPFAVLAFAIAFPRTAFAQMSGGSSWSYDDLYRIHAYDRLEINVWGVDGLRATVEVRPDGRFHFPFLGDVYARGKTVVDLAKEMDQGLREFVFDPQTTINLTKYRTPSVQIQGAVPNPGRYDLQPDATVAGMLAETGNFLPSILEKGVNLLRDGKLMGVKANPFEPTDRGFDLNLRPDDLIVVPEDPKIRVFVSGEVGQPGVYYIDPKTTAWQAIMQAGGLTPAGSLDRAQVVRNYPGTAETIPLGEALSRDGIGRDVPLKEGDLLEIRQSAKAARQENLRRVIPIIRDIAIVYNVLQND